MGGKPLKGKTKGILLGKVVFPPSTYVMLCCRDWRHLHVRTAVSSCNTMYLFMIRKSITLTVVMCLNIRKGTQVQLDHLDGQVLSKTLNVLYH